MARAHRMDVAAHIHQKHRSSFLSLHTGLQGQEKATTRISIIGEGIRSKRGTECLWLSVIDVVLNMHVSL